MQDPIKYPVIVVQGLPPAALEPLNIQRKKQLLAEVLEAAKTALREAHNLTPGRR